MAIKTADPIGGLLESCTGFKAPPPPWLLIIDEISTMYCAQVLGNHSISHIEIF